MSGMFKQLFNVSSNRDFRDFVASLIAFSNWESKKHRSPLDILDSLEEDKEFQSFITRFVKASARDSYWKDGTPPDSRKRIKENERFVIERFKQLEIPVDYEYSDEFIKSEEN